MVSQFRIFRIFKEMENSMKSRHSSRPNLNYYLSGDWTADNRAQVWQVTSRLCTRIHILVNIQIKYVTLNRLYYLCIKQICNVFCQGASMFLLMVTVVLFWVIICLYSSLTPTSSFYPARSFYPKQITIVKKYICHKIATIYRYRYSKDVHRTKCKYWQSSNQPIPCIQQW